MSSAESLKIAIDISVTRGMGGGVSLFVASLINALGQLADGSEIYKIIVTSQQQIDWLKPHCGPNQQFVLKVSSLGQDHAVNSNGPATFSGAARHYLRRLMNSPVTPEWPEVPISNGFRESLGCDVIHFPTPSFVLCALPTIYNPHDLQHLHFPQFCSPETIAWRETIYPAGCHFAQTVVAGSRWIKDDIIRQYRVDPEKVQVIPEGPPTELYPEPSQQFVAQVKHQYQIKQPFALYPAVTWAHKNHIRLLEAIAYLRDNRGLTVQLVCTGSRYKDFWPHIERRIDELKLWSQVKFLGFIPEDDLRAIYHLSQFLVEPTLFEACGSPIFEAWLEGVPVACSNATALPEQVLDGALLFDPGRVEAIASAIESIATDAELRSKLRERGYSRLKDFDWKRTARAYRAVYRRAAGYPLTDEDCQLLKWDWMRDPQEETGGRY